MSKIKLLFTCPHGGKEEQDPDIIERIKTHFHDSICPTADGQGFNNINDALTKELTEKIVENIQSLSGKDPYAVYAKFNRKLIDYNRNEICAFEHSSVKGKDEYLKYHNEILQKIEEMLPQGDTSLAFLFDIHGTREEKSPDGRFIETIIGTDRGHSIEALTEVDPNAFWGLARQVDGKNIRVFPENVSQQQQDFSLDGGHTIKTYGTHRTKPGLVAIQIEVINCIRDNRYCREKFAADMADCIFNFVKPFV